MEQGTLGSEQTWASLTAESQRSVYLSTRVQTVRSMRQDDTYRLASSISIRTPTTEVRVSEEQPSEPILYIERLHQTSCHKA